MSKTAIQQRLGAITLPPTPKTGRSLKEVELATATWTKQAQQSLKRIAEVLGTLTTGQIPDGSNNEVIGNVPTPPGVYFTLERARAAVSATLPILYDQSTGIFSIPESNASTDGFLSSSDWTLFNSKLDGSRRVDTVSPLSGGGALTSDLTLSIARAKADTATLGAAAFLATDFEDNGAGIISLDYTNAQKASSSVPGFLSSTDWTTFNAKVGTSRTINTTAPITGGGDLSANRTFAIAQATGSVNGYLSSTDWTTFNNKVSTSRTISTTAPLTGGGDLSANRTLAIPQASGTVDGYLSAADFGNFALGGTTGAFRYAEPSFSNVSTLLHFDGTNGSTTITDQVSGNTWTANGGAALSTAYAAVSSTSSVKFGNSGNSCISLPTNSKFDVGSGDWSIQFYFNWVSAPQVSARIFQTRDGDVNAGISLTLNPSNTATADLHLYLSSTGSSFDVLNGPLLGNLSTTAPTEVLIVRNGLNIYCMFNGFLSYSGLVSNNNALYYNSSDTVIIGGNKTGTSRSISAYIDEFRFTKGVAVLTPNRTYPLQPAFSP